MKESGRGKLHWHWHREGDCRERTNEQGSIFIFEFIRNRGILVKEFKNS